jgi:hypothetical protein
MKQNAAQMICVLLPQNKPTIDTEWCSHATLLKATQPFLPISE